MNSGIFRIPRHMVKWQGTAGKRDDLIFLLFFPVTILYMELIVRIFCLKTLWGVGLLFILLFSLALGGFCTLLSSLGDRRVNTVVSFVLLGLIFLVCYGQTLYRTIFKTFTTLYSITGLGAATGYWREMLAGVWASMLPLLLLAVPIGFWALRGRHTLPKAPIPWRLGVLCAGGLLVFQLLFGLLVLPFNGGMLSPRYLYQEAFMADQSTGYFGVLTTLRLDVKNLMGLMAEELPPPSAIEPELILPPDEDEAEDPGEPEEVPVVYYDNVMEIDFASLIEQETDDTLLAMHQYFSSVVPTAQNEKTGLWEGKNLIWLCAEGFSSYALDPEITPTLYKLATEGYVFENFYNPVWGVSTSDGEYATCTSLIPKGGVWSFYRSSLIQMPFCLGNQLYGEGYEVQAYHNHTHSYYKRHLSHPNMGYLYRGLGNGLDVRATWPESDLEMIDITTGNYLSKRPFHTYYMTVSGHLRYSFEGNYMAAKNRAAVENVEGSEAVKAYLACHVELDNALKLLLERLEAVGILENTAIVLSGDHYPYGLEWEGLDALNEIAGYTLERNFEIYKSSLIMWSGDMEEPEVVTKPCAPMDLLPTISNLLGIEYDSRLLMGRDIFSDSPGLVVFGNRSWISDGGRYNSQTNTFEAAEDVEVPEGYVNQMVAKVRGMFTYSAKILETDYYAEVLTPEQLENRLPQFIPEENQEELDEGRKG